MNLLHLVVRLRISVAIFAGLCFALGLLIALSAGLGFLPAQHPVGLLGALPGLEGLLYRSLLYWLPGLSALWVTTALWQSALVRHRCGRLGLMLLAIAALGLLGMGVFPLRLEDAAGKGAGAHAAAWLVWLSAWLSALVLLAWTLLQRGNKSEAGLAVLLAGGTFILSAGLDGVFSGPAAQLLCWGGWFAGLAGLAARYPEKMIRT